MYFSLYFHRFIVFLESMNNLVTDRSNYQSLATDREESR